MKTLIIHPKDRSTTFLNPIYESISDKTVIDGGITKDELLHQINYNDRIIMLGHGSSRGLFSVGNFFDNDGYYSDSHVIDSSFVSSLMEKENCIFIWCHANNFVNNNKLNGFYTGMFISEVSEAYYYGLPVVEKKIIDESNEIFSAIVGEYVNDNSKVIYQNLQKEYGLLARTNCVANFNYIRLFYK